MDPSHAPDRSIAELASRQHGIVTRRQLLERGVTATMIRRRLAARRLVARYPAVYAVGHVALSRQGRWLEAVYAYGDGAVLSHRTASTAWGLQPPSGGAIHVSTPNRSGLRRRPGIALHHPRRLAADEVTVLDGVPITTWARTLMDLAPRLQGRRMEDVIAQADRLELFDLVELRRVLGAHPRRAGAPALSALLDRLAGVGPADLRSPAEVAMRQLCDDFDLPAPHSNVVVEGLLVDCHWPGTRLVVEVDGYQFHRTRAAFEADRDRDQRLTIAGYVVARFAKSQIDRAPEQAAHRLRALLRRCGASEGSS